MTTPINSVSAELLPCPFCGATAEMEPWHGGAPTKQLISCSSEECEACPAVTGETLAEAIAAWNRRAANTTADGVLYCPECGWNDQMDAPTSTTQLSQVGVERLRKAAQAIYDKLAHETATVTIFDQEALGDALRGLSVLPAGEGEAVAWLPMKDAPRGYPIVVKQGQWIATVILNPPSDDGHWTDGDSVIHYNGNVLVSGFHGSYDGWLPAGSAPPASEGVTVASPPAPVGIMMVPREPTEAMKEAACEAGPDTNSGEFDYNDAMTVWSAMLAAAPQSVLPSEGEDEIAATWRDLALQFDAHRIEALGWVRSLAGDNVGALAFLAAPPLSGEKVLAERLAALRPSDTSGGVIVLSPAEIQSGHDRVRWAEGLIRQLPDNHDGRNSWLLNYGTGEDVERMRDKHPTYRSRAALASRKAPSTGETE